MPFCIKKNYIRIIYLIILCFLIFILFIPNLEIISTRNLDNYFQNQVEFITSQADNNSIGMLLLQSNSFIVKIILPIYILLSPLPPPILLFNINLTSIFISFGSIINFISFIFLIQKGISISNKNILHNNFTLRRRNLFLISIFVFSNVILVGYSSADYRHNLIIIPFLLLITMPTGRFKRGSVNLYYLLFFIIMIIFIFYIFYKF